MEAPMKTTILEISKLVDIECKVLPLEVSRSHSEIGELRQRLKLMELQPGTAQRQIHDDVRTNTEQKRECGHEDIHSILCTADVVFRDTPRVIDRDQAECKISMDSQQQCEINQPVIMIKKEVHDVEITRWDSSEKDPGHRPTIDNVFGKEWCMNLWRHEESNFVQNEDTNLNSSVSAVETVNLLDDEPDMIMIKDETFEDSSSKKKTEEEKNNHLRRPDMGSSERCVAKSSTDFITYTIPSDDHVQSNIQQTQAEKQSFDGRPSTHGDSTTVPHLNPDEFVGIFPSNMNFNSIQNNTTASEDKKIECVFCGKTFNYLSNLKTHMRTHSGEKPYACTVCGKRFAQKTYLRIHQRIHSGERPYTCMDCGKSFSQKSSLNVHLRSHTGEKPYSCVECGKSYTYKHGFNTHQCSS